MSSFVFSSSPISIGVGSSVGRRWDLVPFWRLRRQVSGRRRKLAKRLKCRVKCARPHPKSVRRRVRRPLCTRRLHVWESMRCADGRARLRRRIFFPSSRRMQNRLPVDRRSPPPPILAHFPRFSCPLMENQVPVHRNCGDPAVLRSWRWACPGCTPARNTRRGATDNSRHMLAHSQQQLTETKYNSAQHRVPNDLNFKWYNYA